MKPIKYALIFSHTDLDGVGGIIISKTWAEKNKMPYEYHKCSYQQINAEILKALKKYDTEEIGAILISDISVNEEVAEKLDEIHKQGIMVILCDHHATAEWLNKYDWAFVAEKDSKGILRCGTYWMAKQFPEIYQKMGVFVHAVDAWDCWKWKDSGNIWAKNLNSLLSVMGPEDFISYIDCLNIAHMKHPRELFSSKAKTMVKVYDKMVSKSIWHCEKNIWEGDFQIEHNGQSKTLHGGIVFTLQYISDIADSILDNHPDLDFLLLMGIPRSLSFRCREGLDIPMGELAKMFTGNGGGHPLAAGAVVSTEQFGEMFPHMVSCLNEDAIKVSNLTKSE